MSRFRFAILFPFAVALSGPAFAQSVNPACAKTQALKSKSAEPSAQTMAGTSSGMGNAGAGASSAAIATGPTDKTGMFSPCTPSTTAQGATGATPTTPGSTP